MRRETLKTWFSHCLLLIALPLCVWGETHVKGFVSGTWDILGTPYIVDSSLVIEENDTLFIEPGVTILFQGPFFIKINGCLRAQGTVSDSIRIWDENKANWTGLHFMPSSHDCIINYVSIKYPVWGIYAYYCSETSPLNILHSNIYAQSVAVWGAFSKFNLLNSTVICDSLDAKAIYLNHSDAHIQECYIQASRYQDQGVAMGIYKVNSKPEIWQNTIRVDASQRAHGIWSQTSPKADISFNLIHITSSYYANGGFFLASSPDFVNNTVIMESEFAFCDGLHLLQNASPIVDNNIFAGDGPNSFGIYVAEGCEPDILYSDFFNLTPTSAGYSLGTGCIDEDPIFEGPEQGNFTLERHSPCINAGNPARVEDPDSTVSDMGCFYFNTQVGVEPEPFVPPASFTLIQAFPNPFNAQSVIRLTLPTTQTGSLVIYDQQGRIVETIKTGIFFTGESRFSWDASRFGSGIYWATLRTDRGTQVLQLTLIK